MTSFDVLNRQTNIHQHHLLEASAGTGKTFAIENVVIRLLIQNHPEINKTLSLEQILVVTFTRASARDLRIRIRTTMHQVLACLRQPSSTAHIPDYLQAIFEQGPETVRAAMKCLELAVATFDQAQIFTIHGFCAHTLRNFLFESDFNMSTHSPEEKNLSKIEIKQLIRDFLRTEVRKEFYSPAQLEIVIKKNDQNIDKLQDALLNYVNKDCSIEQTASLSDQLQAFFKVMQQLKEQEGLSSDKLCEDFDRQMDAYKKIQNKSTASVYQFFKLFDKDSWTIEDFDLLVRHGLLLFELRDPLLLKKKLKVSLDDLNYPALLNTLNKYLKPLIDQARSYEFIFSRMIHDCTQLLQKFLSEEEKHRENDLLKHMLKALQNPLFKNQIRNLFKAAIIDEFQDTDPIQWEIFKQLFLDSDKSSLLYLVGDPKQSIYAFRQADIYTYLNAATSLGAENKASLDTNYRSQPSLVNALNDLFSSCPNMFNLPGLKNQSLEYPRVKHSPHAIDQSFSDSFGSIHFFNANLTLGSNPKKFPPENSEDDYYFPFIAREILHLHKRDCVHFNQFAVLIKDKFQAKRLGDFLDLYQIPYALQRQTSLIESPTWESLKELLVAVLHTRDESAMKIALGNLLVGWNYKQIQQLENWDTLEKTTAKFYALRNHLVSEGFGSFIHAFLQSSWHEEGLTISQRLLQQKGGDATYDELIQIVCLLMEYQSEISCSAEHLIKFLDEYKNVTIEDEERLKKFANPTRDAVSILTTYNSKGLEYDIVFALGLVNRSKPLEKFIPKRAGLYQCLTPCLDSNSESYLQYCEEMDAEKMRQLYVAMTRAKYRLYVPLASYTNPRDVPYGCASPIELFTARLENNPCNYEELYQRIPNEQNSALERFFQQHQQIHITYEDLKNTISASLYPLNQASISELHHEEPPNVNAKPLFIQSFTSLAKQSKKIHSEIPFGEIPHDFHVIDKNPHSLPSSNLTGKLLHKILETVSFDMNGHQILSHIETLTEGTEFESWNSVLTEMTEHSLKIPINNISLHDIDSSKLYRETEFFYPCERTMTVEDLQWRDGFLKGVIDLIFYHDGRYYLIDWKSNWLGPEVNAYNQEAMQAAMEQHHYQFQAHIYKEALQRYLKLVDPRPFNQIFGGCYYIFIRGLNPVVSTSYGVLKI